MLILVKRKKPRPRTYIRAMPITAKNPTPAQIVQRLRFARASRLSRGLKKSGNVLPGMVTVRRYASGRTGLAKKKPKKWQLILINMINEQVKTKKISDEEAKKIIEEVLS